MTQTLDCFLGGRFQLIQPSNGYRAGIDPVFLSAFLKIAPDQRVLDVGAGVGAASFCLAVRYPHVKITGLEIQSDLVEFGIQNIKNNKFENCIESIEGNIFSPPASLRGQSFDQVMTNPPYYEHTRSMPSPIPGKAQANRETADLGLWMDGCLALLKPQGIFTMIHLAERLPKIILHLENKLGNIVAYPLWAGPNKPARRVIIQGRKGKGAQWRLLPGMMLHGGADKYTPEAEGILRHALGIDTPSV